MRKINSQNRKFCTVRRLTKINTLLMPFSILAMHFINRINIEDAGKQFMENINMNEDKDKKSAALYNLGNSLLKANKVQESIDAYKGSLNSILTVTEAKYNLAYAQDLLKQQQEQQQQQQQQQNKDKQDQKKDQDKQDKKGSE